MVPSMKKKKKFGGAGKRISSQYMSPQSEGLELHLGTWCIERGAWAVRFQQK